MDNEIITMPCAMDNRVDDVRNELKVRRGFVAGLTGETRMLAK